MLEFNPYFRPTAKELLKHRVFDNLRSGQEVSAPKKIVIDIDVNEFKQPYGDESSKKMTDNEELNTQIKINIVKEYVKFNQVAENMRVKFFSSSKGDFE